MNYISYIYLRGIFGSTKPEFEKLDAFDVRTVDVPASAVGFNVIEAENETEALKALKDAKTYFLGNADQVVTKEDLKAWAQMGDIMADLKLTNMEYLNYNKQIDFGFAAMGLKDGDVVLDPVTREVVYPAPPKPDLI